MPLVRSLVETLQLWTGDPQEDLRDVIVPIRPTVEALASSWEKHNMWAVRALHSDAAENMHYLYYPRDKALYWWRYTQDKDAFQDRIEDDVFVPSLNLVGREGETEVRSMVIWSNALPQVFPKADYILRTAMDQDKAGEWCSKKKELLPWQWVLDEIQPLTEPCEGPVPDLVVVPSEKSLELGKIFNRLEGSSFKDFRFVAPDGFVDVYLPEKLGQRAQ